MTIRELLQKIEDLKRANFVDDDTNVLIATNNNRIRYLKDEDRPKYLPSESCTRLVPGGLVII